MLQIKNVLVSLDLIEEFFCCDLEACKGACCIEGDAGAPLTDSEDRMLRELQPDILPHLTSKAAAILSGNGPSYIDSEADRVTTLIEGAACVFTCFSPDGLCLCALEKARREGDERIFKPISCSLYPARVKEYTGFTALNLHRWKICRPAFTLGRRKGIRAYEFLREPLIRRFGREWYDELDLTAREFLRQQSDSR